MSLAMLSFLVKVNGNGVLFYRARPASEGSPYDLVVVSKSQVNRDHYTFSASGVVFNPGDGQKPEFTPIGEFFSL